MERFRAFLRRKNIVFSAKRYRVDALGAMAQGLFCTLLVGTILDTLGTQFHIGFLSATVVTVGSGEAAVGYTIGGLASLMVGPAMAVAIGSALQAPPLVLFSLVPVGYATNVLGGAGGPLAVLVIAIIAAECGKLVSKETKVDILVTPHRHRIGGHWGGLPHRPPHRGGGLGGGQCHHVGHGAAALLHGDPGLCHCGCGPHPAHFQCRHLRGPGPHRSGRRGSGGRVLRPDGGFCHPLLPGEPLGRLGVPGPGDLHAPDGQHRPQPSVWIPPRWPRPSRGPLPPACSSCR